MIYLSNMLNESYLHPGSNPNPPRPGGGGGGGGDTDPDVADVPTMRPAYPRKPDITTVVPTSVGPTQDPVCDVHFDAIATIRSEIFMFKVSNLIFI